MQKTEVMNTHTIQFKKALSFEQYQMAVRVLEAIGLEVYDETRLTEKQKENILRGIKQAEKGETKSYLEVREKARKICGV